MTQADREYYYGRAEVELKRAQASDCPYAVKAHYTMADRYLELIGGQPSGRHRCAS